MAKYGFYDRLSEQYPSQIIVDIAELCNLKCIHCPHPTFKESEHYAGRLLEPEINKKLVDDVRENSNGNCQYIRYTSNGEPLLHPKAHEMIQYAVENSGTFVALTTNGTVLNEKKMQQLLSSGLHMIDISIDAYYEATYKIIRGGRLEQVKRNVIRMIEQIKAYGSNTKLVVSFVRQPNNENEADQFEVFWREQGADEVVIRDLHTAAGWLGESQQHKVKRTPCLYPWERLVLDSKGELAFCPASWGYESTFIGFRDTSVKDAWRGEFMQRLREAHLNNDFKCHGFCGQCPDWKLMQWPGMGRAYANLIEDLKVIME